MISSLGQDIHPYHNTKPFKTIDITGVAAGIYFLFTPGSRIKLVSVRQGETLFPFS